MTIEISEDLPVTIEIDNLQQLKECLFIINGYPALVYDIKNDVFLLEDIHTGEHFLMTLRELIDGGHFEVDNLFNLNIRYSNKQYISFTKDILNKYYNTSDLNN